MILLVITIATLSSATATNLPQELFLSVFQWAKKHLKITKPVIRSVRADKFPKIFHLLEQDRIILAPETASEFLRNQVLEKWITNNQIKNCFEILKNNDVPSLRLYFIVGIPGETEKDRKNFVQIVEAATKYVNNIQIVMFPLLMQAGTPFEQFGSIGLDTFSEYYSDFCEWIDPINKSSKTIQIEPAPQLVHLLQGIASTGDRHIGKFYMRVFVQATSWKIILLLATVQESFIRETSAQDIVESSHGR